MERSYQGLQRKTITRIVSVLLPASQSRYSYASLLNGSISMANNAGEQSSSAGVFEYMSRSCSASGQASGSALNSSIENLARWS